MSDFKNFSSFIDTKNSSSTHQINEYKNKYYYNKKNSNLLKKKNDFNNTIKLKINNKTAKYLAMDNINKCEKNMLMNIKKKENKNKIYSSKDLNEIYICLEKEKEIFNNPKPQPMPIKINKNTKVDYNDIIKNIFSNQFNKNNMNKNNNTAIEFYKSKILNDIKIEQNYDIHSFLNEKKMSKNLNSRNKNKIYSSSFANNNYNKRIENPKNKDKKILNKEKDSRLIFILKNLNLDNLINIFNEHCIKFSDLFQLNKYDLLEMNIPIGPRNRIIKFIKDYKKNAKMYDLNEIKKFFRTKMKNGIFINEYSLNSNYELNKKINNSDNDYIITKKENLNFNNKYTSFCKNISNVYIFKNFYENNGKKKNKYNLYINETSKENNDAIKKENINILFNKYNLMSNLLNYNNINKNDKINIRNKNNEKKNENYFTFYNDRNNDKNIKYLFPNFQNKEYNKKRFYKSNSMKTQNYNFRKNNYFNKKISEKRKKFVKKFSNINDEVKIFEDHLRDMRKKSQEINSRVETLLIKRRNLTCFEIIKNNISNHNEK